MVSKLPSLIFCAAAIAASYILDSLGQSTVATTSPQSTLARPDISARTVDLRKRTHNDTQICDPNAATWCDMVKAYSDKNQQTPTDYLKATLGDEDMTLGGNITMASSPYDPNRVFCDVFPKHSDNLGVSFPRCLLEQVIDHFCTVSEDIWMNNSYPYHTSNRGGRWTTYIFAGYLISNLHVGVEFSKSPECEGHQRALYAYNNTPDRRCKDKLLGEIVDRCTFLHYR